MVDDGDRIAVRATVGLAEAREDGAQPIMFGYLSVWNVWAEIRSKIEGHFVERIAPGAFERTFTNDRHRMRVLFQHGRDAQVGDKPLGPIETLHEDGRGGYFEVPLLDTAYNRELLPGLRSGVYGTSFRFRVQREDVDRRPPASPRNPERLPERTIREAQVLEFGPVTFPAYEGTEVGVRSLTDWYRSTEVVTRPAFDRLEGVASATGQLA